MFLFDFLVQRYEIGKLRRRRTVEKFLVIDQSYSFQSDRIPPNPPIVEHRLPGLREKSVSKFLGNWTGAINPASAHSPTLSCAQMTMSGPFAICAAIGKL